MVVLIIFVLNLATVTEYFLISQVFLFAMGGGITPRYQSNFKNTSEEMPFLVNIKIKAHL